MELQRRSLLRIGGGTIAALLAGCTAGPGSPGDPSGTDDGTTPDADPTEPDGGTDGRTVSLVATDDPPALPVAPGVSVVSAASTDDHPPTLRASVTNRLDEPVTVGEGRAVVFAYVADDAGESILLPAGGTYPVEPGCWRLREPIAVTEEYRTVTLRPGETFSRTVGLYGTAGGTGCLQTGQFRFETGYSVVRGESGMPADGETARWGFSVALS